MPGNERMGSCEVPPIEASCKSGKGVGGGPVVGQLSGGSIPAGVAVLAFLGGGGYFGGGGKGMRPDIPGTAGKAKLAPRPGPGIGGSCKCCCAPTMPGGSTGSGSGAGRLSRVVFPGVPLTGGGLAM